MSSGRKILRAKRSQKKDYINSLPDEMLTMIFDHLDLACVKNASLACQRWNSIIFHSGYIRRFEFNINAVVSKPRETAQFRKAIEKPIEMLKKSQRCYRSIFWCVTIIWTKESYLSAWDAIHPKLTSHLNSLEVVGLDESSLFAPIAEIVSSMPQLRSLTLKDRYKYPSESDVVLKLCSSSVKYLELQSSMKFSLDMPQLETLKCTLHTLYLPDNSSEYTLSNVNHLTVFFCYYMAYSPSEYLHMMKFDPRIFRRLEKLETMICEQLDLLINFFVPKELFALICETCPTLKELHIIGQLHRESSVNDLSKLVNLRVLGIGVWMMAFGSMDLSTFTQLEEVYIYRVCNDVKLPMSVRKLTVEIYFNRADMIEKLFEKNSHLIELNVLIKHPSDAPWERSVPVGVLKALPLLKQLEALKFYGGLFSKSVFICLNAPMTRLRRLHFINSNAATMCIDELRKTFPNLEELKRIQCH